MTDAPKSRSELYAIAEGQAGYFTAAPALELGFSYPAQAYH